MALGHPPEREKGPVHAATGQQIEHNADTLRHAARHRRPRLTRDHVVERADLEVLFHVHGEEVTNVTIPWRYHAWTLYPEADRDQCRTRRGPRLPFRLL